MFKNSVLLTAIGSSMASSFCAVVCMTPFDVVATRMFNQGRNIFSFNNNFIKHILFKGVDKNGKGLLYKNIFDCFLKTFRHEGVKGLYKGFVPNYCRTAPHSILNLTFWEQFKKLRNTYWPKEEAKS